VFQTKKWRVIFYGASLLYFGFQRFCERKRVMDQIQNRKKILLLSGISHYGTIIVSTLVGLISVPIGLGYFGPVQYGIWFVIVSFLAYLRISDFGIGTATLTLMSQSSVATEQRVIFRRAVILLVAISSLAVVIAFVFSNLFPSWARILGKIPPTLVEDTSSALLAIVILFLVQLPMTIFTAAFSGLQQVYWSRVYGSFYSLARLGALVLTVSVGGSLVTLAVFTGIGEIIVGIACGIHLFFKHPQIRPRLGEKTSSGPSINLLLTSGIRFLTLQIAFLLIWNTDNLVISHYLGPEQVNSYAVTFKIFQMSLLLIIASIVGLRPLYGQAYQKQEWDWIHTTYNHSVFLQIIPGGLVWIVGIVMAKPIIDIWVGPGIYGGMLVAFALGGYIYVSSFVGSNHSLINGMNPTNIVVLFGLIEAVLNLLISLFLIKLFGIGGVALGTLIASLAVNTWFPPFYIKRRTSKKVSLDWPRIVIHGLFVCLFVVLMLLTVFYLPGKSLHLLIGGILITLYLVISWWIMPHATRKVVQENISKLVLRYANYSPHNE
jgi:O-antigen/teichoic acid export membrane protein